MALRIAALALLLILGAVPASAQSYLQPAGSPTMVFPVARSDWYSVINLRDDWHAPRMRKIGRTWRQVGVHEGNDIFAEPGTPVHAVTGGRVENMGWLFYSGWRVGIRAGDGRYWFYAHLQGYAPGIAEGVEVQPGDQLGYVGNTGYGKRPGHKDEFTHHLHIGIQEPDGMWSNPYPLMNRLYRAAVGADADSGGSP